MSLSWGGKTISIEVYWFQYESDSSRNSNVYQVASKAVCDHFPGEFGSERLVQQVVDHILRVTENKEGMEQVSGHHPMQPSEEPSNQHSPGGDLTSQQHSPRTLSSTTPTTTPTSSSGSNIPGTIMINNIHMKYIHTIIHSASKIILTGQKSRTLHKEELTMSESEKHLRKKIEDNARTSQSKRKNSASKSHTVTPGSKSHTVTPASKSTIVSKSPPSSVPKQPNSKPSEKRIRVTSSDGRTCNLSLDLAVTYQQLQQAIEKELE